MILCLTEIDKNHVWVHFHLPHPNLMTLTHACISYPAASKQRG